MLKYTHIDHTTDISDTPNRDAKTIWANGGIGLNRLDIMERVTKPKAIIQSQGMGVAFAASYKNIAMVHAVEVSRNHRRKGVANTLMYRDALWAQEQGCNWLVVLTVKENIPARALYETLGMKDVAAYHYRLKRSV